MHFVRIKFVWSIQCGIFCAILMNCLENYVSGEGTMRGSGGPITAAVDVLGGTIDGMTGLSHLPS